MKKRVNLRAVSCPDCKAQIGESCKTSNTHKSRQRMATRFHLQQTTALSLIESEARAKDAAETVPEEGLIPEGHGVCSKCNTVIHIIVVNPRNSNWIKFWRVGTKLIGSHSPGTTGTRTLDIAKCPGTYEPPLS